MVGVGLVTWVQVSTLKSQIQSLALCYFSLHFFAGLENLVYPFCSIRDPDVDHFASSDDERLSSLGIFTMP